MALELVQHIKEHAALGILADSYYNGQGTTVEKVVCSSGVNLGDAVYVSGPNTVARAIALDLSTSLVVGFVVDKDSSTECSIAINGLIINFPGITPNTQYFLSRNVEGAISLTPPTISGDILVRIGVGWATDKFLIQIDPSSIIRRS